MTLDPELVRKARTAGTRLQDAEKQAKIARAEWNVAVRRLHLGGASLREIAQELQLSHQRVQQIVREAGGTWWQRLWSTRNARGELLCTFCDRPPSEVRKLVAGPACYICDGCVEAAGAALAASGGRGALALAEPSSRAKCSFCGKRRAAGRPLALGPDVAVCPDCLALCRQIIDERAP